MALKIAVPRIDKTRTREYTLRGVITDPDRPNEEVVLIVRPGTVENEPLMNAAFRRERPPLPKPDGTLSDWGAQQALNARIRAESIDLYAKHVVVGWRGVYEDGKPVECTPARVVELLTAIVEPPPDHPELAGRPDILQDLRSFCGDRDAWFGPAIGADELGKR